MPSSAPRDGSSNTLWKSIRKHLNFYRVHILFFLFTPLIFSGIFYASNGRYHVSYIDALYNCVSAMTVCGLATVNLSSLTGWQQAILFIQMCLGSPVVISWVMVYTRRYYFAKKFQHIIEAEAARKLQRIETRRLSRLDTDLEKETSPWRRRVFTLFRRGTRLSTVPEGNEDESRGSTKATAKERKAVSIARRLTPNMIRRMDAAPQLVDPSGWISEGRTQAQAEKSSSQSPTDMPPPEHGLPAQTELSEKLTASPEHVDLELSSQDSADGDVIEESLPPSQINPRKTHTRRLSDPGTPSRRASDQRMQRYETVNVGTVNRGFSRTQTVEFAPNPTTRQANRGRRGYSGHSVLSDSISMRPSVDPLSSDERRSSRGPPPSGVPLHSYQTTHTNRSYRAKQSGFGGFPMPHELLSDLFSRLFPKLQRQVTRTLTMPQTLTQRSHVSGVHVPYVSFDAIVGRNSTFRKLTNEQLEELGGVEYRALNSLLWIVMGYHLGIQLLSFIVIAPYMSLSKWKSQFLPPQQFRPVPSAWFSIFQVVSSYTNTGTSLVDQSMVPFQTAYPMIVFMIILILAGNTAFPVFLRFLIWIISKLVPKDSRLNETLHFLLDHPRRCFIYLFPSHQTWFLLTVLIGLNCTDWFFFMVLDIGNPAIDSIPLGTRFLAGLLQAVAVRAAGFGIVTLAALAPAVKVLYVIMMYISVYPIAMSVRSTNVYEEQSLGVFKGDESDDEEDFQPTGTRVAVWSRYLAMHARKQLSFDMWWLGLALFLVCIVERGALNDEANQGWFSIFSIVFELVSAYGTVGLSLGIPTENYSLSGALRPLSKLIVCLVMLRGRHRGLPVAIDRAVMLPVEFQSKVRGDRDDADGNDGEGDVTSHRRASQGNFSLASRRASGDKISSGDSSESRRRRAARKSSSHEAFFEETRRRTAMEDRSLSP